MAGESIFDFRGTLDGFAYLKEQEGFTTSGTFVDPTKDLESAILLSSTSQFKLSRRSEVSSFPVAKNNSTSSDNVREHGAVINISGVISDQLFGLAEFLFSSQKTKSPEDYAAEIKKFQKERKLVSVHLPDGLTTNNCVITSSSFTRDKKVANGFNVELSLQELLITNNTPVAPKAGGVENQASDTAAKGADTGQGGEFTATADAVVVAPR